MSTELATLAADPDRVDSLHPNAVPALLGELEALKARLWVRLQSSASTGNVAPPAKIGGPDRLLTVDEAAAALAVSRRWLYRKASTLPFTKRLSEGALRFSEKGLERWKETRR